MSGYPRASIEAAVVNGRIYAIGGLNDSQTASATVEVTRIKANDPEHAET
ncbi:MAG: hypothetical protein HY719_17835 [Planctomycetes bacterium]|nr:hypothetical protein [Planctomycetota bacterium]